MTSSARFSAILDNLDDGVVIHADDLRVIEFNQQALTVLNLSADQLRGTTPMDPQWRMVHEDGSDFGHDENPAVIAITTGETVTAVMGLECGRTPIKWIRIRARAFDIEHKRHAIVTFADITAERLTKVENQLVLANSGIGIWRYNIQTQDLTWDESMYSLYNIKPENFTGVYDAWVKTLHPEDIKASEAAVADAIAGKAPFDTSFRIIANNQTKYIRAKATILQDAKGQPHLMIGTNWDITDVKETESELKALAEVKDRFIATVSHELRTPLNGIIGMSELIAEAIQDAEQHRHIRTLVNSANHLNDLISGILDFSKLKSGKMAIAEEAFDIGTMIKETAELHEANLDPACRLEVTFPDGAIPPVVGDKMRLTQVFANLLSNAIKFTHQGNITVKAGHEQTQGRLQITIAVTDTGIGIPKDQQAGMFKDFFQGDSSRTRRYGGTGIGLSISQKLMDLMGGKLDFTSIEGEGSTFWFTVTLKPGKNLSQDGPSCSINQLRTDTKSCNCTEIGIGRTALIMEDNPVNRLIAVRSLEQCGFTVEFGEDGIKGLERYYADKPDVILLDLHMPNKGGTEVLAEIRSTDSATPIIIFTAETSDKTRQDLMDQGANGYLHKPMKKTDLHQALQAVFSPAMSHPTR